MITGEKYFVSVQGTNVSCVWNCIICMELTDTAGGVARPDTAPQFSERSRVALETESSDLGVATGNSVRQPYLRLCVPTMYSINRFINPWTCMFNVQALW